MPHQSRIRSELVLCLSLILRSHGIEIHLLRSHGIIPLKPIRISAQLHPEVLIATAQPT